MKKRYLPLMLTVYITALLMMPFSVVKAATNVTQYANGLFDYGSWTTYYAVNSNGYVITDMFDEINVPAQWESALITKVDLNNYYNGQMTLQLTGNINTNMWEYYVDGDGVYSIRTTDNNKISIYLNNCHQFYIYAFCGNDNDTNFVPYQFTYPQGNLAISPNVAEFYDSFNEYQLIDHYFPSWNLTAYLWGKSYSEYEKLYGLDLPWCTIPRSTAASYEITHRIPIQKNQKIVVYILSDQWLGNSQVFVSSANGNNIFKLNNQFSFPRLTVNGRDQVLYLNEIQVWMDDDAAATQFSLGFNVANLHAYPVFIGNYYNVPNEITLLTSSDYRDTYTKLLQKIVDALSSDNDSQNNPANDIISQNTQLNQITSDIDAVDASITGTFDQYVVNVNLNDYNIFSQLQDTSYYFKTYLDAYFSNMADFKALIIVPVIVTILFVIIGWVI